MVQTGPGSQREGVQSTPGERDAGRAGRDGGQGDDREGVGACMGGQLSGTLEGRPSPRPLHATHGRPGGLGARGHTAELLAWEGGCPDGRWEPPRSPDQTQGVWSPPRRQRPGPEGTGQGFTASLPASWGLLQAGDPGPSSRPRCGADPSAPSHPGEGRRPGQRWSEDAAHLTRGRLAWPGSAKGSPCLRPRHPNGRRSRAAELVTCDL